MKITDDYVLFWGSVFSNFYTKPFVVDDVKYASGEQYMMAMKAVLMGDELSLINIMATIDPREAKKLGRKVENWNDALWDKHKISIMCRGLYEKFNQNPQLEMDMLEFMVNDNNEFRSFVEASPFDKIWGIGLGQDDPKALNPEQWQGQNLLGKVLDVVALRLCLEHGLQYKIPVLISDMADTENPNIDDVVRYTNDIMTVEGIQYNKHMLDKYRVNGVN